jgi:hypothetical protein
MRGAERIDWTRTRLQPRERENLLIHQRDNMLTALTSEQKEHLLESGYVWVKESGVLWKPPEGARLRRSPQGDARGHGDPDRRSCDPEALVAEKPEKKGGAGAMGGMPDMGNLGM